ncbi:MAG: DUF2256 domain-containing protein [Planctomycetota bacterium]
MQRGNAKQQNLPTKTCPVCGRDFTWRKKWERDWANVKYCSKACGKQAKAAADAKTR